MATGADAAVLMRQLDETGGGVLLLQCALAEAQMA